MIDSVNFLLMSEAAEERRESVRTWERRVARGEIAVHRLNRRVLIARTDFDAFMKAHRVEARRAEDIRAKLERIANAALAKRRTA